jgi:Flp pilus assembly protein TadD
MQSRRPPVKRVIAAPTLGELDAARHHLEASIRVDKQNPLPAFNMGVLFRALQDQQQAEFWFQEARRLGYSKGIIDRITQSSQTRFANIDGRGRS